MTNVNQEGGSAGDEPVYHAVRRGVADHGGPVGEKPPARQYAPAVPREQAALEETESLLRRVYRGSVGMMVNTLADGRGLTDEDIEELSAVLEKARRERK